MSNIQFLKALVFLKSSSFFRRPLLHEEVKLSHDLERRGGLYYVPIVGQRWGGVVIGSKMYSEK